MRAAFNSNTMTTATATPGHPWPWRWLLVATVIEAKDALRGVVAIAETTENPHSLSTALLAEGLVDRYIDPTTALAALPPVVETSLRRAATGSPNRTPPSRCRS